MPSRPAIQQGVSVELVVGQLGEPLREERGTPAGDQQSFGEFEIVESRIETPYLTIVVFFTEPRPSMLTSTVCPFWM